ncbi:glycosyltransferase family 87 protein [Mucilaginibacter sp. L3T2-6]|uniref:glycosyltransferase family 87 protein n=1 Tax=Mucilaginibacter sp. L3T2-6 TaxID=3062491 RepID=UPI002675A328|nr:glycosyltransferase family 87 protein [Mucilaginibacter sp. L3T2-6]MDO3643116.1 glycosyltransferase family 87 protein [Mucilaginibacter sp. L3T2-6]MDV6215883.1 glycosyltransferase family 87 protein [Mucilaginibacter sp. L3T2-6]
METAAMQNITQLFTNKKFVIWAWFVLSLLPVLKGVLIPNVIDSHIANGNINNYIIYKHNFLNLIHQHSLFGPQPEYYFDLNHYGPVFALIIAPFTIFPDGLGAIVWVMFNSWVLYLAIMKLPLNDNQRMMILLINIFSIVGSAGNTQVNPLITALILFSLIFIRNKQDFWAALMIIIGTAIKLYGIVGLAFFFFSDNKIKLILSMAFWAILLFALPMLISSPAFIIKTYHDWYPDLVAKNAANVVSSRGYVCVMGMISKIFHYSGLPNKVVLIPALLIFATSMARVKYWRNVQYQLSLAASVLIFTTIFSSGSEPPTYIIAMIGVGIWYTALDRPVSAYERFLLIFALVLTNANSDLFPRPLRLAYVTPYALIAFPSFLIWLKIVYEMLTRKYGAEIKKDSLIAG